MELIPPELSMLSAAGLVVLSFITSMLTAAVGIGGGLLMLTVMVSFLPPIIVLPVHGVIQLGSNGGRLAVMRQHVDWRIWGFFAIGSILGVILAGQVFINLSLEVLRAVLGLFVLYAVWTPKLRPSNIALKGYTLVGIGTTFITMFVGATGPLVSSFLSPEKLGRERVVATLAACMTIQHGLKGIAFGVLGFYFQPWIPVIVIMIATGFLGTLLGRRILKRLPERLFSRLFRIVLTLLAGRLLYLAITT
ncbi:uncharacterized protein METZ01_LOCUS294320 [marine metagenome]|uniref:Membrane transporter protein n=1 Tax=marine metagenome TaxID=408172 RepID=A0A382LY06_9ZZZZ